MPNLSFITAPWPGWAILLAASWMNTVLAENRDPETWFREDYVPLWFENDDKLATRVGAFYAAEIMVHEPGDALASRDSAHWLNTLLRQWTEDGWIGSSAPDIRVHRINGVTASFTTRWLDRYAGGEELYSCGWYLADLIDGEWKFTRYAEMDCEQLAP